MFEGLKSMRNGVIFSIFGEVFTIFMIVLGHYQFALIAPILFIGFNLVALYSLLKALQDVPGAIDRALTNLEFDPDKEI